jgi:hypothetical protein
MHTVSTSTRSQKSTNLAKLYIAVADKQIENRKKKKSASSIKAKPVMSRFPVFCHFTQQHKGKHK